MKVNIEPSAVRGSVSAPASKSSMQRACAAALLSNGTTTIRRPGRSNDDLAAIDVITRLGARIDRHTDEELVVVSNGVDPVSDSINCGESGLGIRMFTPLAALSDRELVITGTGSLLKRPMHFFDEIMPKLGVKIESNNGYLPIRIRGPLTPVNITVDGSLSSQFLTGLLMAYGAAANNDVVITVTDLKSRPYIDLTLQVMRQFGVDVRHENYEQFRFLVEPLPLPSGQGVFAEDYLTGAVMNTSFVPGEYTVEGDWSGGAFLLVAGAIRGEVIVSGLDTDSTQADRRIMQALADAGANVEQSNGKISVSSSKLSAFSFDATDCPDLFPPVAALAAYCSGVSEIKGVSRLAHKESDRGITLQEELGKMGVKITLDGDIMRVAGGAPVHGAVVHSRHDHRIAMACAVAALGANGSTVIEEGEAINKSFPEFYDLLRSLTVPIHQNHS